MAENRSRFTHNVFKNDPILFKSYVNKKVSVLTEDGNLHTGIVYTVDPVSESIVLIQLEDTSYRMKIILGHSVKNVEVSSDPETVIPELFSTPFTKVSETAISERKNAVKNLLLENRFPVTEDNEILRIEDALSIEPPYELHNCICNNSIILDRIQTLLSTINK